MTKAVRGPNPVHWHLKLAICTISYQWKVACDEDTSATTGSGRADYLHGLSQEVIFQHDDLTPHTARRTRFLSVVSLGNSVSFTPLFGPLKQHLEGRRFHSNELVEIILREWLWMQEPGYVATEFVKSYKDGGKMHGCAWGLCWKITNKWARFSVALTFLEFLLTLVTLFIELPLKYAG